MDINDLGDMLSILMVLLAVVIGAYSQLHLVPWLFISVCGGCSLAVLFLRRWFSRKQP